MHGCLPRTALRGVPWRVLLATITVLAQLAVLAVLVSLSVGMHRQSDALERQRASVARVQDAERAVDVYRARLTRLGLGEPVSAVRAARDAALRRLRALHTTASLRSAAAPLVAEHAATVDPTLLNLRRSPDALALADARLRLRAGRLARASDAQQQRHALAAAEAGVFSEDRLGLLGVLIVVAIALTAGSSTVFWNRLRTAVTTAQRATSATERRYASMVRHSSDLTLLLRPDGQVTYASAAAQELLGQPADAVVGTHIMGLVDLRDHDVLKDALTHALRAPGEMRSTSLRLGSAGRDRRYVDAAVTNLLAEPDVAALVVNMHDVTDRHRLQSQLTDLAFRDSLTGLANRALLLERLASAASRAATGDGTPGGAAVLLLDLDDFKAVNDSLGHEAGDRVLEAVAMRVRARCRASDVVARLGGDEFVVFAQGLRDAVSAGQLAEGLVEALGRPVDIGSSRLPLGASVGVRYTEDLAADRGTLLRDADLAMYAAKAGGKNAWALFEPEMHRDATDALQIRADLHGALDRDEFVLQYQPIIDAGDGDVRGFEALVRWQHPELGLVAPGRFIALAEASGLIGELGAWVLDEAAAAAVRLRAATGRTDLVMNVNVSTRQLFDQGFARRVRACLARTGLPGNLLTLELTESIFLSGGGAATALLEDLRGAGVRIALDDFGTGYSSLSYLERLPVDTLKIDRSFIATIEENQRRRALTSSIIALGGAMQIRTVAEGVETIEQLQILRQLGCDRLQGYLFSAPVTETEATILAGSARDALPWHRRHLLGEARRPWHQRPRHPQPAPEAAADERTGATPAPAPPDA